LVGIACTESPDATVYVGIVADEDQDTFVAVAVQGDRAAAFFCDGDPTPGEYPGWLAGSVRDGAALLGREGWTTAATFGPDGVTGVLLEPDGETHAWVAAAPREPLAGFYASFHDDCATGVIVMDPSPATAPLVRGAWWCDESDDRILQVTPLLPLTVVDEGLTVEVTLDTGTKRFDVAPLTDLPR